MVLPLRREVEVPRRWRAHMAVTALTIVAAIGIGWLALAEQRASARAEQRAEQVAAMREWGHRQLDDLTDTLSALHREMRLSIYPNDLTRREAMRKLEQLHNEQRAHVGCQRRHIRLDTACVTDPLRCL